MTKRAHILHVLFVVATAIGSVLIEALSPGGPLAHAQWAAPALGVLAYVMRLLGPTTPPPAAFVGMLIGSAVMLNGCQSILGPTPPPGTPGFVNCSDTALHDAALDILPAVENALATDNYESALATLAASIAGPLALAEVECAVAWVETKAEESAPVAADSLEATKAAHAKAWLATHHVTFAVAP